MYSIIIISFRKVHTSVLDYSRKTNKRGWGYGISRVIEEIANGFSGELIKSNVDFPGVIKEWS